MMKILNQATHLLMVLLLGLVSNDAQKIISEMVVKGEREAKTRRNAFKYASKRSRGLYY